MSQTIQIRQQNPDDEDKMAKLESESDVYGYLSRKLGDKLGEYIEVELEGDEGVEVPADGVTGSGSGNYVTFESAGGNIVGFGIHLDILEDVADFTVERDENDAVQNAPESVQMAFSSSTEEAYESAQEADEEEADALIVDADDSDEESTDEDAEAEALVAESQDDADADAETDDEETAEIADDQIGL
jgi:hypothetical protein